LCPLKRGSIQQAGWRAILRRHLFTRLSVPPKRTLLRCDINALQALRQSMNCDAEDHVKLSCITVFNISYPASSCLEFTAQLKLSADAVLAQASYPLSSSLSNTIAWFVLLCSLAPRNARSALAPILRLGSIQSRYSAKPSFLGGDSGLIV